MPTEPDAPPLVEVTRCPGCDSAQRTEVLAPHGGIAIVKCDACGLVHATHGFAPRFLDAHYGDRVHTQAKVVGPRPGSERKRPPLALYQQLSGNRLRPAPAGGRALDIGCNTGLLLDLLREAGYQTVGIERSPAASEAHAAGHQVHALDIESDVELSERFDLITMTHVLEHLRRPGAALRWIRAHLRPSGFAVIEVPNWDDLARPLWGARYRPLELGDHLTFFQRQTLADLARGAGLRVHALWSAPKARSLIFPSMLTGVDLGVQWLRRGGKAASANDGAVGVASARVGGGGNRLRRAAVSAVLHGLDRLDPVLERVTGPDWSRGANLVAVVELGPSA
ncbi:MAG: class I SAM-dependent methyltransferase [Myxococcota bacterium]